MLPPVYSSSTRVQKPSSDLLKRVVYEAEIHLNAQLSAALAADQRALVFASFLGAACIGLLGSGASLLMSAGANHALGRIALGTGTIMLVAVALAVIAARPVPFWFVGDNPASWEEDVIGCRPLDDCFPEIIRDLRRRIELNDRLMRANGRLLRGAMFFAFGAIFAGAIAVYAAIG